jgi:hypothetical protein
LEGVHSGITLTPAPVGAFGDDRRNLCLRIVDRAIADAQRGAYGGDVRSTSPLL